jgi:HNH endonuclease
MAASTTTAPSLTATGSTRAAVSVVATTHSDGAASPLRPLGPWGRPPNPEGRWIDPKGYVFIRCPVENHPNAKSKKGWIAEHVWVMTQMLGRPLRPGETVHHRNLIKGDNRPSNLELWTSHQPKGARVADMFEWCWRFIAQYADAPEWTALPGGPLTRDATELNQLASAEDPEGPW